MQECDTAFSPWLQIGPYYMQPIYVNATELIKLTFETHC